MSLKDDLPSGLGPNAWHLTVPLEECRCLFEGLPNTGILIDLYICKCGKLTYGFNPHPQCEACGNTSFLHSDLVSNHKNELMANIDHPPVFEMTADGIYSAFYYIRLPEKVDIVSDSISYRLEKVYQLNIKRNGMRDEETLMKPSSYALSEIYHQLLRFIADDLRESINNFDKFQFHSINSRRQRSSIVEFFLLFPQLADSEFYYWDHFDFTLAKMLSLQKNVSLLDAADHLIDGRAEKSLRKALFAKLHCSQHFKSRFDPVAPYLISRFIKDPNIACMLLGSEEITFGEYHKRDFSYIIETNAALLMFLSRHYSEKQLATIMLSIGTDEQTWRDTVRMYDETAEAIHTHFQKPKCRLQAIHDEFVHCSILAEIEKEDYCFEYDDETLKACVRRYGRLEMRLPHSGKELRSWGILLKNCLFTYVEEVREKRCTIVGAFRHEHLLYAIEIFDGRIVQMSGRANSAVPQNDRSVIQEWFHVMHQEKRFEPGNEVHDV